MDHPCNYATARLCGFVGLSPYTYWPASVLMFAGLPYAVRQRAVLRPRGATVLRDALPRQTGVAVRRMPQADRRPVHHSHVQEVPPRALCVRLLLKTAQQGHLQRTKRQAVLSFVFWKAVRMNTRPRHRQRYIFNNCLSCTFVHCFTNLYTCFDWVAPIGL